MSVDRQSIGIVVVDDEPSITKAIRMLLRREGYTVHEFNDPLLAQEKIPSLNVQIVISDMRMPEMDGAQLLKVVKEQKPNARRILLTGFSDTEASVRAINEGGVHVFIQKPWSNDALKAMVAEQIEEYAQRVRVKVAAKKVQEYAKRAEFFKSKLADEKEQGSFEQSERELRVFTNIFNSFLMLSNSDIAQRQEKATALAKLLCHSYNLSERRARIVNYACRFFPINVVTGRKGTQQDPYLFETLPLRFSGHLILEKTAHLLQLSLERPDRSGPLKMSLDEVPIDAQIIAIAIWTSKHLKEMQSFDTIAEFLRDQVDTLFTLPLVTKTIELLPLIPDQIESNQASLDALTVGQELAEEVRDGADRILLAKGTVMTANLIEALKQYEWRTSPRPEVKVVSHPSIEDEST